MLCTPVSHHLRNKCNFQTIAIRFFMESRLFESRLEICIMGVLAVRKNSEWCSVARLIANKWRYINHTDGAHLSGSHRL
jgi:hypothetical protein